VDILNKSDAFPWFRYIRLSGPEGEGWVREYDRSSEPAMIAQRSIGVVRRSDFAEGEAMLGRARAEIESLPPGTQPSVRHILERWYYSALAFYFYAREAYEDADALMVEAGRRMTLAIERSRCLLPLAMDCYEIQLQRARAARECRDWDRMWDRAEAAASMRAGRVPFCTLSDGTSIALRDIQRYCRSISLDSEEDRQTLESIVDEAESRVHAERVVRLVLKFPGMIVQYP
jgi:hypothetical protein